MCIYTNLVDQCQLLVWLENVGCQFRYCLLTLWIPEKLQWWMVGDIVRFGWWRCCCQTFVVRAKGDWEHIRIPMSRLSCRANQCRCFLDVQVHIQEQQASYFHPPVELCIREYIRQHYPLLPCCYIPWWYFRGVGDMPVDEGADHLMVDNSRIKISFKSLDCPSSSINHCHHYKHTYISIQINLPCVPPPKTTIWFPSISKRSISINLIFHYYTSHHRHTKNSWMPISWRRDVPSSSDILPFACSCIKFE